MDEAVAVGEAAVELSSRHPWSLVDLGITYLAVGRKAEALAFYEELEERAASTYVQHSKRAILAAHLGRIDEAFALLATAVEERDGFLIFMDKWPPMDPLRNDARFDAHRCLLAGRLPEAT